MYFHHAYLKNKFIKTTTIGVLYFFGTYLYASFFTPYLQSLGWSSQAIGLFFSLFAAFGILFAPMVGALSDAMGRFHLIMIGILVETASLFGYIFFTDPLLLFVIRIFSSLSFTTVTVATLARVEDTVDDESSRSTVGGLYSSIQSIAVLLAPLAGGLIADHFGYEWNFTFALISMILLLCGVFVYDRFNFKDDYLHRKKEHFVLRSINPLGSIRRFWSHKELRPMAVLGFAANFSAPFRLLIIPMLVIDSFGLTNTHLSIILFIFTAIHLLQYHLGKLSDRYGAARFILLGNVAFVILSLAMIFVKTYALLIVIGILYSLATSIWNVSAWSYMSAVGERYNIEGQVVGGYMSITHISHALSFVIVGLLLSLGSTVVFLLFAGLIALGLLYAAGALRNIART